MHLKPVALCNLNKPKLFPSFAMLFKPVSVIWYIVWLWKIKLNEISDGNRNVVVLECFFQPSPNFTGILALTPVNINQVIILRA